MNSEWINFLDPFPIQHGPFLYSRMIITCFRRQNAEMYKDSLSCEITRCQIISGFLIKGQMDTAQGTFQLSTLPSATLHDVVQSYPFWLKRPWFLVKALNRCASGYIAAGFALARTVLYLSNFNCGIFNGCGRPFECDDLRLDALKRAWKGTKTRLAAGSCLFQTFVAERVWKKPLTCMSFAVAFQGFLPVEAIFAATLGFRLRQCGNQLAILAQNYGMDQWIAVTMVRDSCCLLPVWIGQCPMAMNMLELPLLLSGKTEKWGAAVFKLINTVADVDSASIERTLHEQPGSLL